MKLNRKLRLVFVFVFLVSGLFAAWQARAMTESPAGTIYHVATTGNDTSGCGSASAPCRSLQYVVDLAQSGDTLLVAGGSYTYTGTPLSPTCYAATKTSSVLCVIDKHLTILGGYSASSWLQTNAVPTIIDGQNTTRGITLLSTNRDVAMASLKIEHVTIQNGYSHGASSGAEYEIGAYGGGLFADSGPVTLNYVKFLNNRAVGGDTSSTFGGAAAGAGMALNQTPRTEGCFMSHVIFDGNQALGGQGGDRGGSSLGGGFYIYLTVLDASYITMTNNIARAGSSSGNGVDAVYGLNADGLGGGATIHGDGNANLRYIYATENYAIGGNAGNLAGHGQGGVFFAENAINMTIRDSLLIDNYAIGGNGQKGGIGGDGAVISANSTITIDRTRLIANVGRGGDGSSEKGSSGGGGLYAFRLDPNKLSSTVTVRNSVIADNILQQGSGPGDPGGGGIWAQAVDMTVDHTTLANNQMDPSLVYGSAAIFVNFGATWSTTANLNYCIISDHADTNPAGWANPAAIHVWNGNTVNFNHGLFANNSNDTNAENDPSSPSGPGAITGLSGMIAAASAGYVSAGNPSYNYHITTLSSAKDKATGSTMAVDMDNQERPAGRGSDLGADEYVPFALGVYPNDARLSLVWSSEVYQYEGGVDHYEIYVTCPAGATRPIQGGCNGLPINTRTATSLLLTGLTNGKTYTVLVRAKNAGGQDVATSLNASGTPFQPEEVFLPLVLR